MIGKPCWPAPVNLAPAQRQRLFDNKLAARKNS
jgi:hypothetical protein